MALLQLKHLVLSGAMTAFVITTAASATPVALTPAAPISDYWNLDDGKGEQVDPKLAANGSGQLVVIWTLQSYGNIQVATSHDNGITWTDPMTIYTGNATPLSVHHTGTGWVAQWTREAENGNSEEHLASRSTDGTSWTAPELVQANLIKPNSNNPYAFHGDAESDGANTLLTSFGPRISRSLDGGLSWTNILLPDASNYQTVAKAQIASAGANKWYLFIRGTYYVIDESGGGGGNVIHLYTSTNNGTSWSGPINDIYAFGPSQDMAARGDMIVVANYPSFYVSADGGNNWQTIQPGTVDNPAPQDITVDQNGNWAVAVQMWGEDLNPFLKTSGISLLQSTDPANGWSPPTEIAADPSHRYTNPVIQSNGNGSFAVAYQSYVTQTIRPGADSDVVVRTSGNAGASWSASSYANTDHATDFSWIDDYNVQLVSGDNGDVIAVWSADTDRIIGHNHVMFARSEDYGATWSNTAPITPAYDARFSLQVSDLSKPAHFLVYAGQGRWVLKFDYGLHDENISYYSISDDNGFYWSAPAELNGSVIGGNGNGTVVKYMGVIGNRGIHAVSRLPRNSTAWEEPFMLPGDTFFGKIIVNTSQQDWFITAGGPNEVVYTSDDDGRSWMANTGTNVFVNPSRFDVDEHGTVVAIHNEFSFGPPVNYQIYVSRSTDNGVSWTTPESLGRGYHSAIWPVGDFKFGDIAYVGNNIWIIAWQNSAYSVSTDGGVTWSSRIPVPYSGMGTHSLPNITGANGRFTIAWQQAEDDQQVVRDSDIYYAFGTYGTSTAAQDWQLFE